MSTNLASTEAGGLERTRGQCFIAIHIDLDAVATVAPLLQVWEACWCELSECFEFVAVSDD